MSSEQIYRSRFEELVGWYRSAYSESRIKSCSGTTIRLAVPNSDSAHLQVVIVSGRTEFIEKYLELARDLQSLGLAAILYDHCGQGGAGRLLEDREKGHIDHFDTYVEDLHRVIEAGHSPDAHGPVALLSHSMGGTVSLLYARHSQVVADKIVLVSPMCAIRTGVALPQFLTRQLVGLLCRAGLGERYVATAGPYNPDRQFKENLFTTDADRFGFNRYLSNTLDFARLGGPTYRWLHEAFKAMKKVENEMALIKRPLLTLGAREDRVIQLSAVRRLCSMSNNCRYQEFDQARHELLMENDRTRSGVISQVRDFLVDHR